MSVLDDWLAEEDRYYNLIQKTERDLRNLEKKLFFVRAQIRSVRVPEIPLDKFKEPAA